MLLDFKPIPPNPPELFGVKREPIRCSRSARGYFVKSRLAPNPLARRRLRATSVVSR
jgi:hypothetical protein